MEELKKIINDIFSEEIIKLVISNKSNKDVKYNKINILLKENKTKKYYQIEKFTDKQVFHENISLEEIETAVLEYIVGNYKQFTAWSNVTTYDVKISKKGKVHCSKKGGNNEKLAKKGHNKEKNYILKEGMIIEPLIDLGVFTKEGKVINSKYDKYKQINRFIEIIDDEIKKNDYKELTILDFGCGKSYLTFVLYYYFVEIKKIDVKMIGLDLKEDVIKKCNDIAKNYGYKNLSFELGDINGYKYNNKVDMVITLHACDTATDYALYHAINMKCRYIFSVPCCQHEINNQLSNNYHHTITKFGILKDRFSAILTDSIRANILQYYGYKTQIKEFVDFENSPKNLLIRAKLTNNKYNEKIKEELDKLMNDLNVKQTLYSLLFLN